MTARPQSELRHRALFTLAAFIALGGGWLLQWFWHAVVIFYWYEKASRP